MKVSKENIEENKVELVIEVSEDKVASALDKAYKKVVKEVNIPGFRKGKVPKSILIKKFGAEVLHKDALDILIPEAYYEAVQETEIEPIAQPDITDVFIEAGKPAKFTAEVEVKPEVELGEYKELGIEKEEVNVSDEQVEEELNHKRGHHAQLVATDRAEVQEGDHTVIDFEGFLDGEAFEGGAGEDYNLEIGSGQFIPGFEEQLVGVKVGEEVEVNVTFPEEYNAENLAGQDAVFKVTVKEIKVKEMPELDDEFAKDLEFETLDELKADIKEKIAAREETRVNREFENKLVDAIADNTEVNIPETMVENEIDNMLEGFRYQIMQQGFEFDQYLEMSGIKEEDIRADYKEAAEKRAKANLVLETIAKNEGIEVSDEDLDEKLAEIAERQGQDKDQIKMFLQMQGQLASLKDSLQMEKTIDFLVENN
ncbi:trigger factor [Orenia metallireducens]|jgi:trigger factor|uniref:Trigger factor n=1 Tax=Orenia metallireducens TaxID=1413210 RepID=A0A285HAB5_9FIRM|nr:trigger factor [Orenia metallireducens]PRX28917.1 trigger factor [Orenia metallireducens]SNY32513.1 trigger factor [Orenia metallireducens]